MPKIRLAGSRLLFCDWGRKSCWGLVRNIKGLMLAQAGLLYSTLPRMTLKSFTLCNVLWGSNQGFLHVRRTLPTPLHPSFCTTPGYMSHNSKGSKISTHQNVALVLLEKSKFLSKLLASQLHSTTCLVSWVWLSRKGTPMFPLKPAPLHPSLSESMAPSVVHTKAFGVTLECPMSNPSVSLKDTANIQLFCFSCVLYHISLCLTSGLLQQQWMEP